jgi:hypothetical protein
LDSQARVSSDVAVLELMVTVTVGALPRQSSTSTTSSVTHVIEVPIAY